MANSTTVSETLKSAVVARLAEDGPESAYGIMRNDGPAYSSVHATLKSLAAEGRVTMLKEDKNEKGAARKTYGLTMYGLISAIGYQRAPSFTGRVIKEGNVIDLAKAVEKNAPLFRLPGDKLDRALLLRLWDQEYSREFVVVCCALVNVVRGGLPVGANPLQKVLEDASWMLIDNAKEGFFRYGKPDAQAKEKFQSLKEDPRFVSYVRKEIGSRRKDADEMEKALA